MMEWYEWICFRGCDEEQMMEVTQFKQYSVNEACLQQTLHNLDKMAQIRFLLFNNVCISHMFHGPVK